MITYLKIIIISLKRKKQQCSAKHIPKLVPKSCFFDNESNERVFIVVLRDLAYSGPV